MSRPPLLRRLLAGVLTFGAAAVLTPAGAGAAGSQTIAGSVPLTCSTTVTEGADPPFWQRDVILRFGAQVDETLAAGEVARLRNVTATVAFIDLLEQGPGEGPPLPDLQAGLDDVDLALSVRGGSVAELSAAPIDRVGPVRLVRGSTGSQPAPLVSGGQALTFPSFEAAGGAPVVLRLARFAFSWDTQRVTTPDTTFGAGTERCVMTPGSAPLAVIDTGVPVPAAPQVTSLDPAVGDSDGGRVVTVRGRGFGSTRAVEFDPQGPTGVRRGATFEVIDDETLRVTTPAVSRLWDDEPTLDVVVRSDFGASENTPADDFRIDNSARQPPGGGKPEVTGLSRRSGSQGRVVRVTGTNLDRAETVSFGGRTTEEFTLRSPTELDVAVPDQVSPGPLSIRVEQFVAGWGTARSANTPADDFTVTPVERLERRIALTCRPSQAPGDVDPGRLVRRGELRLVGQPAPWVQPEVAVPVVFRVLEAILEPQAPGDGNADGFGGTFDEVRFAVSGATTDELALRPGRTFTDLWNRGYGSGPLALGEEEAPIGSPLRADGSGRPVVIRFDRIVLTSWNRGQDDPELTETVTCTPSAAEAPVAELDPDDGLGPNEPPRPLATPSAVAPTAVYAGLGGIVRVRGTNLRGTQTVNIGGARVRPLWVASDRELWVLAPALRAGTYPVTLTNAGGTSPAGSAKLTYRRLF